MLHKVYLLNINGSPKFQKWLFQIYLKALHLGSFASKQDALPLIYPPTQKIAPIDYCQQKVVGVKGWKHLFFPPKYILFM